MNLLRVATGNPSKYKCDNMDMNFDKPIFLISLDTELLWGFAAYDYHEGMRYLQKDPLKGRGCINSLLNILEKNNVVATWAVVGHLFLNTCNSNNRKIHENVLSFRQRNRYLDINDIEHDPLYFGSDIVENILSNKIDHEIGSHSFTHTFFSQCSAEVAEIEVMESLKVAKKYGIALKSFVYPENKIGHQNILKKHGFHIYRGENLARYKVNQPFATRKINGFVDKIVAPPSEIRHVDGIWEVSSSMFFCDPQFKSSIVPRAKIGLNAAMKANKLFHIFLHPHNLLAYPSLIRDLDVFLSYVSKKHSNEQLDIMTMSNLANSLDERLKEYV